MMRSYFYQSPEWLQGFYPHFLWKVNTTEKAVFLTFDDGPDEQATAFVLDQLDNFNAKATFFCIGRKVQEHPEMLLKIVEQGHGIGNHTFQHVSGWSTRSEDYVKDVEKCCDELQKFSVETSLFRPPYGRIRHRQGWRLLPLYQIVMWSHLAGDFDKNLHLKSAKRALLTGKEGSIFLFHDSFAAYKNLKELLPVVLEHYSRDGYRFKSLSDAIN